MKDIEYLREKLQKLSNKFGITFSYQFDTYSGMHIVEVTPVELYEDIEYGRLEFELTRAFDKKFRPESLLFVTINDVVKVEKPEFTINPEILQLQNVKLLENMCWPNINTSHSAQSRNSLKKYTVEA